MKKILVPTDFSDCANAAVTVALDIAKKAQAEIYFLHMHETAPEGGHAHMHGGGHTISSHHHSHEGHHKNELDKLVRLAEQKGVSAKPVLVKNTGNEQIISYIEGYQVDLVIMGTQGTSGLSEFISGSTAQRIVRESPVPVLVVKEGNEKRQFKNIVFASSFEEDVHKPYLRIVELADLLGAHIHLLYVNMPFNFKETDEAEANMHDFHKKCPRGTCSINIYNALNEERGIQKFANSIHADVIALTTHGRSGFLKLMSRSVTESLVNHSQIPVLSVNINVE
ncbi:MAG TPA: universal stress protein [Cyclobacteriaceae bacterium]|nr:universal stress protein [Cyclobacteriaceae bacterium]